MAPSRDIVKAALLRALAIGSGGFLGALARYGLGGAVQGLAPLSTFPWGTLAVNLLGCLVLGGIAGLVESRQLFGPEFRAFALIGLVGGFTTFATFGFETFAMLRDGESLRASANVLLHVLAGLAFVWLGWAITASR